MRERIEDAALDVAAIAISGLALIGVATSEAAFRVAVFVGVLSGLWLLTDIRDDLRAERDEEPEEDVGDA